jgi:hypothetical protein
LRGLAALSVARLLAFTLIGLPARLVSLVAAPLGAIALVLPLLAAALLLVALVSLATLLVRLSALIALVVCHSRNLLGLPAFGHHGPGENLQSDVRHQ